MKRLALLAAAVLSGCAVVDPYGATAPDPWYASPPPVYVHPGYGWSTPYYGSPYWGPGYGYAPYRHRHLRTPAPVAGPPAASPPPRAQAPAGPRPQHGHAEESFMRIDVPPPAGGGGARDNAPYGRHDQP